MIDLHIFLSIFAWYCKYLVFVEYKRYDRKNVKIYLHYSINEHTYAEHIQYLIRDLEKSGFQVFKDIKDYSKHEEVALYFPSYLKEIVNLFVDFQ